MGVSAGNAFQSGSPRRTAATASDTDSPPLSMHCRPLSISNSTHPNAQISLRLSAGLPRACSGLI
ncbi:MAG: hypothetical protein A3H97_25135 [Acidobacteria bacterium RIFCSPLOWO2_02_FULL_65_29]|nr:MAG: hypothetical protein A3H97_25135 [Acidobacteria bacterium RIFCSPLOWO2_02_FULL_65_29]